MRFRAIILFFITLIIAGCSKEKSSIQTKIIGHAGSGMTQWSGLFVDNSLEGIKYALSLDNCYGVEIDISISADSTLWLFHDSELSDRTNGQGCVRNATDEYLSGLHYKTLHQEKLVKLKDVLFLNSNKEIILDGKNYSQCQQSDIDYGLIKRCFEKLGPLPENVAVNISTMKLYAYLKDLGFPLILKIDNISQVTSALDKEEVVGFMFEASKITKEEICFLQDKNYKVYLYEVRSIARLKKELKKQPDYILVDDLLNSVIVL